MIQKPLEIRLENQAIRGSQFIASDKRGPAVVMCHGFAGQRLENGFLFVQLSRLLADRGISSLIFDYRGAGESDGQFGSHLVSDHIADAVAILEFTARQTFTDRSRIGLLGFSLGGLVASYAAASATPIKAMTLLAPTTPKNLSRLAKLKSATLPDKVVIGAYTLRDDYFTDLLSLDSIARCIRKPRPTQIIQGTADQNVPPAVSDEYLQALRQANIPISHLLIEGANHGFSAPEVRQKLLVSVIDFMTKNL